MLVVTGSLLLPATATPQGLTGTLIGTVRDAAGRRRRTGASPCQFAALIGGSVTAIDR